MDFTVKVRDQETGQPVGGAVVMINAYQQANPSAKSGAVNPSTRTADAGGTANFVAGLAGGFNPPLSVDITVFAAGYAPWTTGASPVTLAGASVEVDAALIPFRRPVPSRDRVCSVTLSFQGLTVETAQFGTLPWFEGTITSFASYDRQAIYAAKRAAGDTHCGIDISWNYAEPGQPYGSGNLVPPCDLTQDLATFRSLVREIINAGFVPLVELAGDGESNPNGGYNDPIGWTYGYQWLMDNLPRILEALRAEIPYCLFCPGYDGVFYGWEPSNEKLPAFGRLFRELAPNGYLAIEHNTGHIPIGNGPSDWTVNGPMSTYDVVLSEFDNWPATGDPTWQVATRLLQDYVRPPDQPATDDPPPHPWYLAPGNPRGPYYACAFEYAEYAWVRGQLTAAQVADARAYYRSLGYQYVG